MDDQFPAFLRHLGVSVDGSNVEYRAAPGAPDLIAQERTEILDRIWHARCFSTSALEAAVVKDLLTAVNLSIPLEQNQLAWAEFCYDFRRRSHLKAPLQEDQKQALYHVIRWLMRDLKGWADAKSWACYLELRHLRSVFGDDVSHTLLGWFLDKEAIVRRAPRP